MRVWGPMDWNLDRNLLAIAAADCEEDCSEVVVVWKSRAPDAGDASARMGSGSGPVSEVGCAVSGTVSVSVDGHVSIFISWVCARCVVVESSSWGSSRAVRVACCAGLGIFGP